MEKGKKRSFEARDDVFGSDRKLGFNVEDSLFFSFIVQWDIEKTFYIIFLVFVIE